MFLDIVCYDLIRLSAGTAAKRSVFTSEASRRSGEPSHADGVNARAWHPYRCGFCDYSTRYKGNLLVHERIHTGERPFACRLCSHSFSHRSHLTTHLRRHTGERPFVCSLCHRTFTRKNLLGVHFHKHHRGGHSVP
ncbi:unnamed protein product [Ixodes persulcatus]